MPTLLDNQKAISRHDAKDMLGAVEGFPEFMRSQLQVQPPTGKNLRRSDFRNIVFMGMGGSASAGDLVLDWLEDRISVPAIVHRDPILPKFVGPNTFFVTLSYSGDTRETLAAFREARKRGSNLVAIGTGGKLQKLSAELDVPFLDVQPATAPRAALGQMVVATIIALHSCGIIRDPWTEVDLAVRELGRLSNRVQRQVPLSE